MQNKKPFETILHVGRVTSLQSWVSKKISIRVRNLFVCTKHAGTCFPGFTKKYSFGYDTFIQSAIQDCSSKNMNI